MEFKKPKAKKNFTPKKKLITSKNDKEIVGVFNGQFVTVRDFDSMNYLYELGRFGKGNLSKGQPNYHNTKDDIKIMIQQQFENHVKWHTDTVYPYPQKYSGAVRNDFKLSLESVSHFLESSFEDDHVEEEWKSWKEKHKQNPWIVDQKVNSSFLEFKSDTHDNQDYKDETFSSLVNNILQSRQIKEPNYKPTEFEEVVVINPNFNTLSTDFYLANLNPVLKKLPFVPHESLNLGLEESLYLKSVLGCLKIVDLNFSEMGIKDLWEKFNSVDNNFTERYITYNYYRKKNWVVRSGLKFGGDYLLYKDGPECYHGSYVVKVLNSRKKLTWREFIGMNRLVETFNKDLLLCNVVPDETTTEKEIDPSEISNHSVEEVLVRRWFPTKERFTQDNISN